MELDGIWVGVGIEHLLVLIIEYCICLYTVERRDVFSFTSLTTERDFRIIGIMHPEAL